MLNLIHARTFLTVVEVRGVRAAARQLDLAPSTVADHIRQLEEELATPLIARDRGAFGLTPQGARLLPLARALVTTAERLSILVHQPWLRVAAASNIGTYMLQQPVAAFQRETDIEVEMWIGRNIDVAERIQRGESDLAVMEWWEPRKGFVAQTWSREPLVVIVGPKHRWASLEAVNVQELVTEPLLGGEPGTGTGRLLQQQFGALADRLKTTEGFGSTEAVKRAVRAGRGASIVLEAAVTDEVASGQLVMLPLEGIELAKEIKVIVPDGLPSTAPAMKFLATCVN
ncbi:Transcriptional regulator [Candidatus Filomicrobium marinum]|uniref:Transcriptional regulator n=1 Tax=Candidatus Filomicrobium marinum TaxID=1608628 RepID=A0A0D6JCF0_9HYPH|nr:LysR family transcriptional regulator [Candidatus Filomicrobium marinum]CFX08702.1 Transcriptional regulator [Candidatus Filomicrobium marinum]CPR16833.1 Transcriptional regulator [Candidatus Filomicrobium marinum]